MKTTAIKHTYKINIGSSFVQQTRTGGGFVARNRNGEVQSAGAGSISDTRLLLFCTWKAGRPKPTCGVVKYQMD